jgi:hypothetical protein
MRRLSVLIAVIVLIAVACNSGVTVDNPAPEATFIPTELDFDVGVVRAFGRISGLRRDLIDSKFRPISGLYLANECLKGDTPTFSSFVSFTETTLLTESQPHRLAPQAMRDMLTKVRGDVSGIGEGIHADGCLKSYTYPSTPVQARAATDLYLVYLQSRINPLFWSGLLEPVDNSLSEWFASPANQKEPLLTWLCSREDGCP